MEAGAGGSCLRNSGIADVTINSDVYYFAVHTSDWQLSEAPLPLTLGP